MPVGSRIHAPKQPAAGHLDCLTIRVTRMDALGIKKHASKAVRWRDTLECLKYAHMSSGCPWDAEVHAHEAASTKHTLTASNTHTRTNALWDEHYMLHEAAVGGRLEFLKYAHENGCFWDERDMLLRQPVEDTLNA